MFITPTRIGNEFGILTVVGNGEETPKGVTVTTLMSWQEADALHTALGQHLLDWHLENNPADKDEAFS